MGKERTVTLNDTTYTLVAMSGETGVLLCDKALYRASTLTPGAGEFSTLPANSRHPHTGAGKLFMKSVSGAATVHFMGS